MLGMLFWDNVYVANAFCTVFFVMLIFFIFMCAIYYLCQGEHSEHWRSLRDWSFCPSWRVCVHDDSSSSPHVIHNRQERWRPPVKTSTFYSSNV